MGFFSGDALVECRPRHPCDLGLLKTGSSTDVPWDTQQVEIVQGQRSPGVTSTTFRGPGGPLLNGSYAESIEHRRSTGGNLGGRPKTNEAKERLVLRLRDEGCSYRSIREQTGLALSTIRRIIAEQEAALC